MERWIDIPNAVVVGHTEAGLECRVGTRQVMVPRYLLKTGTQVRAEGDRGTLVVPMWFAADAGLLPAPTQAAAPISRSSFWRTRSGSTTGFAR